jgi:hypothetical protein
MVVDPKTRWTPLSSIGVVHPSDGDHFPVAKGSVDAD